MAQIHEAIIAIMGELDAIGKNNKNASQGFNYRGIDDVYNALHTLMAKHGVFSTSEIRESISEAHTTKSGTQMFHEKMIVVYTFFAKDGSSVNTTTKGIGMDSGDKAANKAIAIAHKYALLQLFAIPTVDLIDPDAERPEGNGIVPPKQESKQESKKTEPQINPPKVTNSEKPNDFPNNLPNPASKDFRKDFTEQNQPPKQEHPNKSIVISEKQVGRLHAMTHKTWTTEACKKVISENGFESSKQITRDLYEGICNILSNPMPEEYK